MMIAKKGFRTKVLLAPSSFGSVSKIPLQMLRERDIEVISNGLGRTLNEQELLSHLEGCNAVIAGTEAYNQKILTESTNLKIISRLGVGIDNIDLDIAKKEQIFVSWCSTSPSQAVAELVLSLFLNLSRSVVDMNNDLKSGIWKKTMGSLVSGKTVGVIGLGSIGKKFVEITQGLKLNYLAYDLHKDKSFSEKNKVQYVSLKKLLEESDMITIHVNSSIKNKNMIDLKKLRMMKKSPILINTSRGDVIDEASLKVALKEQMISGLGLDVFKNEPFHPDKSFLSFNNVIFTPHIAAYAGEIRKEMEIEAVNNLLRNLDNE
tara:strand:+ start:14643 stop:15599 length:957 start_codon:yes stop_codon:yes gene_type:complete